MAFDSVPMKAVEAAEEVKPKHEPEVLSNKVIHKPETVVLNKLQKAILDQLNSINSKATGSISFAEFLKYGPVDRHSPSPSTEKSVTAVLLEARKIIEEKGWGRGYLYQPAPGGTKQNFCILGAIEEANGCDRDNTEKVVSFPLRNVLGYHPKMSNSLDYDLNYKEGFGYLPYPVSAVERIARFNDTIARDKNEILNMFDRAIYYSKEYNL